MLGVYCPGDVHWARLEASALGSLIAACPAWKRREKRREGEAGIFDSILQYLIRTFTSQAAKETAKKAAKHVGKAALEPGKTVAVDAGKKLSKEQCSQKHQR